jgi:hypothetical protein
VQHFYQKIVINLYLAEEQGDLGKEMRHARAQEKEEGGRE